MILQGMRKIVTLGAVALTIVGASAVSSLAEDYLEVTKDGVNLRSGPSQNYEVLFQLPEHYPLKVLARKGQWVKVSDFEGDKGWIYESLVKRSSHVIVKVKECNVRSGPGTNADKVGSVAKDVILQSNERNGDWIKVSHPQITGWVYRKLVWP